MLLLAPQMGGPPFNSPALASKSGGFGFSVFERVLPMRLRFPLIRSLGVVLHGPRVAQDDIRALLTDGRGAARSATSAFQVRSYQA